MDSKKYKTPRQPRHTAARAGEDPHGNACALPQAAPLPGGRGWGWGWVFLLALLLTSCAISYKFNGASIDYSKTKTIQIDPFPIRSTYVWAPMQAIFNNKLTDIFAQQTKLQQVRRGGDMVLAGEITGFDQYNKGVSADGYSSQVQLKMTVNVRFTNNKNHKEDFERQFSATTEYDATQQLTAVQEELVTQMTKDICEQMFNAAVANW